MRTPPQKLYCYVDESGQDPSSREFVAVAIVVPRELKDASQRQLLAIERATKTSGLKWHKTKLERGLNYLTAVMEQKIAKGETYRPHIMK